ncbi:MAG: pitrilysin family protein [Isosphaeraceae bacterium]|nr:pitrilysin family protein [Isosphaeraceae bacterium]
MRSVFSVILAGLAIGLAPAARGDAPVFPFRIESTTLPNGLRVLSIPFDSPGIIAYYTVVRTGSRNEVEEGLTGFAHFFEHMMFRGTKRYSAEAYNAALKSLGADSNAFTSDDLTCYHMTVPASALAKAVELEADRFQNLEYDEPAFQKEARAVLGEYNKSASSPYLLLNETMQEKAYTKHTYRHTTIGFLDDVKAMPTRYAYSKVFFDRWYRPENCTVIVAGDVKHAELVELAKKHYGAWKRGSNDVVIPEEPEQTSEREAKLGWPLPTLPIRYLGWHIPASSRNLADHAALGALAQAYFGATSPLYKSLVIEEQKVVTLGADAESKRDPGLFTILVRARSAADLPEIQARIDRTLADAATTPLDAAKLAAVKSHLRYAFAASLESADAVALAASYAIAVSDEPDGMNRLHEAYAALTPADLQRVAAKYFAKTNRTVVTLETTPAQSDKESNK